MKTLFADIFVPDHSKGLAVDADVLQRVLGADRVRILKTPQQAFLAQGEIKSQDMPLEAAADIAIFIERIFEHELLSNYRRRVLIPNPEWLTNRDVEKAKKTITDLWHKTRFSAETLAETFPQHRHEYIGFSSFPVPLAAQNFNSFAHFAGQSKTRHTQDLIDLWLQNENFPMLTLQAYGRELSVPKWIQTGNLNLFLGFLNQMDFQSEFARHGIHLCTSQMEGFGHYINEARSIGALVITLNAPPMNELIDENCGILIQPTEYQTHNRGVRFNANPASIKRAIVQALEMPPDKRILMGQRAKSRFATEQSAFSHRLKTVVQQTMVTV